ncbi:uncharacterized protein DNG_00230 [Cephalotrichum gorgonifer]|uniref:Dynamitin domain-containing protein n=1 Tax=Cephalotrichum gorgonifer TaxID=2041049 RepID=A0AAE8SR00_9PEZI|nr:uncharacterized protein DNG_00230 [Cephalotrichum gorgonifer]
MELSRKYAGLPDLDSAPDIYETPELTDDNSTVPGTTLRSRSEADSDEDTADETGISRSKLRVSDARSRFDSKRYNSAGVDWSDRLDSKRRIYRSNAQRSRILEDGTEELGDLSDEDDDEAAESLERKIARLKREVEEAKEEYARRRASAAAGKTKGEEEAGREELGSLGQILEEISRPAGVGRSTRVGKPLAAVSQEAGDYAQGSAISEATYTVTYAPAYEQSHALAKAAEFEQRLVSLERTIGVGSTTSLELGLNGLPRAILPTVESMHQQISALGTASTTSLDAISRRVRAIVTDIDNLNKRKAQKIPQQETSKYGSDIHDSEPRAGLGERRSTLTSRREDEAAAAAAAAAEKDDQAAKINALYGTLATIENLAPLLQPLLDRLRSLRAIHADAAAASETLDRIEKQQVDTAAELRQWREGLKQISAKMEEGGARMEGNMKVMDAWVKDLESRMGKLSA